jgi:Flp pilus assembly protein CpaB
MAEEEPRVQNKGMLVVSLVLALVVVLLYNVHVNSVRREARGELADVLRVTRDILSGDRIARTDIEVTQIAERDANALGNVLKDEDLEYAVGKTARQRIRRGNLLLWAHVLAEGADAPSQQITPGYEGVTLDLDPRWSPGDILRPGDLVDVIGIFHLKGKPSRAYRIIPAVRVRSVGKRSATQEMSSGPRAAAPASYRSVLIEVKPDVVLPLTNVISNVQGGLRLVIRNRGERLPRDAGQIHPELADLPAAATGGPAGQWNRID